jgi:hypothetical protein
MRTDQDFLLYPLGTEDQPHCPACGKPMTRRRFLPQVAERPKRRICDL